MLNDPNRVKEIFLGAAEQPDEAARAAYLDHACGGDAGLRNRVEALLRTHDPAGSFLGTPAAVVPDPNRGETMALDPTPVPGSTRDGHGNSRPVQDDESDDLHFLSPSTRPDSLGRLGHYEILQVLGKGGFGIVFRAFDDTLQRVVAVKVMAPQLAATSPARKRFLREARSSAAVRHENVVQVYEVGELGEQPLPYLTMEFIPGETLQQKLDRCGPLDVSEILRIGRQIAEGLAAAHACDLIHRDIKPGNILLEGGSHKAKITDFGLARAADDASISQSGIIAGTPMFMAPEQALGHHIDQRADLFSLGSVLYQMASGRPPFRAPSALAVLKRVAEEPPRPIPEIIPETPDWLCGIIAKLHAKKPDERFQSAREVADLLADCEAKLKAKQEVKNVLPAAVKPARRKWVAAAAAAVLLLPVIALAVTEFAGVTHLFRQHETPVTGPVLVAKNELPPLADGWVRLFNGKDLTGWKTHDLVPGNWRVEDGAIVGRGDKSFMSFLFSESEYADFHLLVEAKINAIGDSGVSFRAPFDVRLWDGGTKYSLAGGYEAQIAVRSNYRVHTGSLYWDEPPFTQPPFIQQGPLMPHRPDEWFELEVIAQGNRIQTFVNGKKTVDYVDEQRRYDRGHLALLTWGRNITFVQFRKIEIKELPPDPESQKQPLPPTFKNSIGMEFVIVPKGKSWLGGGKDKLGDQEVEIPADFYLGKYEVTQEEWQRVMGHNPSASSRKGGYKEAVKDVSDSDLKRFPVEYVSMVACQNFVEKLNKLEKEPGWEYRLPTAVEWEYACRGGPMTDKRDGTFDFYFAKPANTLLAAQANFNNGLKRPCKVGSYEPNVLGLYDMHGNVGEWCDDPEGGWVVRGSGWQHAASDCRAENGSSPIEFFQSGDLGLRVARVRIGSPWPEVKTPPLAVAPFTDADVRRIAALPAVEQLEEVRKELMRRNPDFDGKVGHKIEGGVVTELRIITDNVTDLAPIRAWNALRLLECRGTYETENGQLADLTPLEGMNLAGLTGLNLANTKVSDAGMVCFKDCKGLRFLDLSNTKVTDAGMVNFKECKDLRYLDLSNTKVTDSGLAHFKDCKHLTELYVHHTQLGDAGLAHFKDCKALTRLYLVGTKVSDAGLAQLKGMPLRALLIYNTGLTDLTPLQGMPLEDVRLTPKNITRGLDILRDMKSLQTIGIDYGNKAWPAAEFWERYDKGEFTK